MAWALVHLADGGEKSVHTSADAESAARYEVGRVVRRPGAGSQLMHCEDNEIRLPARYVGVSRNQPGGVHAIGSVLMP